MTAKLHLNDKFDALVPQPLGQLMELIHTQRNPKVGHGDGVTIHLVGGSGSIVASYKVCNNLRLLVGQHNFEPYPR